LLHTWPTLRRWLDETQEDAAFLDQLRQAAKNWQAKNFAPGLLWRGEAMDEAQRFARRYRGELPQLQRAYLDAVFALAARAGRRKRAAVIGIITFLSLLLAAAGVALVMIREAQRDATESARRAQEQLTLTRQAQSEARTAQEGKRVADKAVERTNAELRAKNTELQKALGHAEAERNRAEIERERAERARQRARRARNRAEDNAAAARQAQTQATAAKERWQKLHAIQKARADELARHGTFYIRTIPALTQESDR
ncbi:MAG: AAA family ATPase, partial [Proteobacteria bacterium]|nr:AAA family ATPase [Pseudomonadota bacterium]